MCQALIRTKFHKFVQILKKVVFSMLVCKTDSYTESDMWYLKYTNKRLKMFLPLIFLEEIAGQMFNFMLLET